MNVPPALSPVRTVAGADTRTTFALDVRYYLAQEPRQLPSRYLYDRLGSSLFEAICCLPWYAVTRAETRLLAARRDDIFSTAGALTQIIELGCGNGDKLATLLQGRRFSRQLDLHLIDISEAALARSARRLDGIEGAQVHTHEAPYELGLTHVHSARKVGGQSLALFLGSNLGNFDPPADEEFLRHIRASLRPGDSFLLGTDLVKPQQVLQLAYDDPLGVTAAFNRNLLVRINRELGGNFDLAAFAHGAVWNVAASRMEMHLVSLRRQVVRVETADIEFSLERGETIWTESSYKYEPAAIAALVERAGFARVAQWIDAEDRFALTLVKPA